VAAWRRRRRPQAAARRSFCELRCSTAGAERSARVAALAAAAATATLTRSGLTATCHRARPAGWAACTRLP
jgi:hypothetical protein